MRSRIGFALAGCVLGLAVAFTAAGSVIASGANSTSPREAPLPTVEEYFSGTYPAAVLAGYSLEQRKALEDRMRQELRRTRELRARQPWSDAMEWIRESARVAVEFYRDSDGAIRSTE